ncbi:uncharacterized protein BO95DRAFT_442210 [Aspergillus brunneoviolaceus CBS 621.78]|uniref:Uncharacterized protein n=1 Tax=Aspergillus brunneoviolaceus CBS 621.78 TaxID=1450534 RepID=A0ACD1GAT6_9EURO|nr:hypothetical protein BO95DRAFT_442210 [Aspergillus brunneoviolaceus CBS 621.78]RAH46322.1 hypothetical protein BO95DRAFT_442210 [Aspergillus brunneoviolaceus CBS 621.78]
MYFKQLQSFLAILVVATTTQAEVTSASSCIPNINNQTFALFSHAPITFSRKIASIGACEQWCSETDDCQAWLYLEYASQCDLHRATALATSPNELFAYGGCAPAPRNLPAMNTASSAVPASVASPSSMFSHSGVSRSAIAVFPSASAAHKRAVGHYGSSGHGHFDRHSPFHHRNS